MMIAEIGDVDPAGGINGKPAHVVTEHRIVALLTAPAVEVRAVRRKVLDAATEGKRHVQAAIRGNGDVAVRGPIWLVEQQLPRSGPGLSPGGEWRSVLSEDSNLIFQRIHGVEGAAGIERQARDAADRFRAAGDLPYQLSA